MRDATASDSALLIDPKFTIRESRSSLGHNSFVTLRKKMPEIAGIKELLTIQGDPTSAVILVMYLAIASEVNTYSAAELWPHQPEKLLL